LLQSKNPCRLPAGGIDTKINNQPSLGSLTALEMARITLSLVALGLLVSCESGTHVAEPDAGKSATSYPLSAPSANLALPADTRHRVTHNPYADVDWTADLRLKSQLHDHVGTRPEFLAAYDRAGYDVVALLEYSGNAALPYAQRARLWPPESVLPQGFQAEFRSIRLLLPSAEEVGLLAHLTSPFVTQYIEGIPPSATPTSDTQYQSLTGAFSTIRANGGVPCIAHPWTFPSYTTIPGLFCVEIYSAFTHASRALDLNPFLNSLNPNLLVSHWDYALQYNQQIWGIAVNDHFGPQGHFRLPPPEVLDSGKIIVLSHEATLEAYQDAFTRGAFFAIEDREAVKDLYPTVTRIDVTDSSIEIETDGQVSWHAHGRTVGEDRRLILGNLPPRTKYVRAEIQWAMGNSKVYTQPFTIRPRGDVNDDAIVDSADATFCQQLQWAPELFSEAQVDSCEPY